jgi:hypothetical protein
LACERGFPGRMVRGCWVEKVQQTPRRTSQA